MIREVVLFARVNDMTAPTVARRFQVPVNSVYGVARRMGVRLRSVKTEKGVAL